jgi:putative transposase
MVFHDEKFETRDIVRRVVFEYIEVDYNRIRRHSTNGQTSPAAFEAKRVA